METQSSLNFMDNIFFVIKSKKKRKKKLHLKKKYIKRRYKRLQGIIKKRIKTSRSVKKYFRVRMRRY
jgi:aspartyl-tRNA synthetase